jgi:hypothetical protein
MFPIFFMFSLMLWGVSEKTTKQQTWREAKEGKELKEVDGDMLNNILHFDLDTRIC